MRRSCCRRSWPPGSAALAVAGARARLSEPSDHLGGSIPARRQRHHHRAHHRGQAAPTRSGSRSWWTTAAEPPASIAARQVARSAPDGYTILLAFTGTLGVSPSHLPERRLRSTQGFRRRSASSAWRRTCSRCIRHVPARSVADLIAIAKAVAGQAPIMARPASEPSITLAGELLASMAGIKIAHIPYKGTGPALNDLLGGHISMMFVPFPARARQCSPPARCARSASPALQRSRLLPDIPTFAEAGLPGFEVVQRSTAACAGGHAAIDRRAAQQGAQRRACYRRGEETARARRRRAACRARRKNMRPIIDREVTPVVQAREGDRPQSRMKGE